MTRIVRTALALGAAVLSAFTLAPAASAASGITWEDCPAGSPAGYQCGRLDVPLSYTDPDGARTSVALSRLPASEPWHKLGTIFTNPGGPGNAGRFSPVLTPELHKRYDLVGFDPRGIGASEHIHCFTDPSQVAPLARIVNRFPTSPAEERQHFADAQAVSDLCEANAGPLAGHLSTATIARDLDRLRAAFGERKLRYYGLSYGTVLGEMYANLFPSRVGSLVLDAVDDPVNWTTGYGGVASPMSFRLGGYLDAQNALRAFFSACSADARCVFRGGDLAAKYDSIVSRLPAASYPSFISFVHDALTDASRSASLAAYLQAWYVGSPLPPEPGGIPDMAVIDSLLGGGATLCSDSTNPRDASVWPAFARLADASSRGFGSYDTYKTIPCATWNVSDAARYAGPWNHPTAPILLLANRQGDPDTPFAGAQRTSRLLANADLLSLDTFGHGSIGRSACVDAAVERYFSVGSVPARGTVCSPDHGPFD